MSLNLSVPSDSQKKDSKMNRKRGKVQEEDFPRNFPLGRTSTPVSSAGMRQDLLKKITRTINVHSAPNSARNSPIPDSFRQWPHARSLPGSAQNSPNVSRESSPGTDFHGKRRKGGNRGGKTYWSEFPGLPRRANTSNSGANFKTDWNKNVKGWNAPRGRSQRGGIGGNKSGSSDSSHTPKYKSPKGFQTSYHKRR